MRKPDEIEQLDLVTLKEFDALLEAEPEDGLILLAFVAGWAGPCNLFDTTMDQAEQKRHEDVLFLYCDVDDQNALAKRYDCKSLPSFVLFCGGEPIAGGAGYIKADKLIEWIDMRVAINQTVKGGKK